MIAYNDLGGEKMIEEKSNVKIPTISVSQTGGLTSIEQLVDSTSNEIFSFEDSTSEIEEISIVFPPSYEKHEQNIERAPIEK